MLRWVTCHNHLFGNDVDLFVLCLQVYQQHLMLEELSLEGDKTVEINHRLAMKICDQVCRPFVVAGAGTVASFVFSGSSQTSFSFGIQPRYTKCSSPVGSLLVVEGRPNSQAVP